jgi:hypothetical protein
VAGRRLNQSRTPDYVGDAEGDAVGDADGEVVADGEGERAPLAGLTTGVGVAMIGVATGVGAWFVKKSASGTMIMPTMTVSTNVTAPHSRRTNCQFTSGEF